MPGGFLVPGSSEALKQPTPNIPRIEMNESLESKFHSHLFKYNMYFLIL